MCDNETLATGVGQEKPTKDVTEAYDSKHGKYAPRAMPAMGTEPPPSTVSPFKLGGK